MNFPTRRDMLHRYRNVRFRKLLVSDLPVGFVALTTEAGEPITAEDGTPIIVQE